jgi:hypothetical protein
MAFILKSWPSVKAAKKNISSLMIKIYILSTYLNFDFYQSLTNNINKLMVRYPEKFDTDKAIKALDIKSIIKL